MTFSATRVSWLDGTQLAASEMADLDSKTVNALDGLNGGVYTPSSQLVISGSAGLAVPQKFGAGNTAGSPVFSVTGTVASFTSSGTLTIGAPTTLSSTFTVGTGGSIVFSGTGTITATGTNKINVAGQALTITDSTDPTYQTPRTITYYQPTHYFSPDSSTNWTPGEDASYAGTVCWINNTVGAIIRIPFRVPPGMTITSVSVPVGNPTARASLPQNSTAIDIRLISSLGTSPTNTSLLAANQADPSGSVASYQTPHLITATLTSPYTPSNPNEALYIKLYAESGTNSATGLRVWLPMITGTVGTLRGY